LSEELII